MSTFCMAVSGERPCPPLLIVTLFAAFFILVGIDVQMPRVNFQDRFNWEVRKRTSNEFSSELNRVTTEFPNAPIDKDRLWNKIEKECYDQVQVEAEQANK